ncbi:hypothetical protein JCM5353_006503 [Sporobolomyces roseus]
MNLFRILGDLSLFASKFILTFHIHQSESTKGVSFETQLLYLVVYMCRYLDLLTHQISLYNTFVKVSLTGSTLYTILLIKYKSRRDPHSSTNDSVNVEYLAVPCLALALVFNYILNPVEVLWAFSIYLEVAAPLPQLFILQRREEVEGVTIRYLIALVGHRAFYLLNWIYRFFEEQYVDPIAAYSGLVQLALYFVFFASYLIRN